MDLSFEEAMEWKELCDKMEEICDGQPINKILYAVAYLLKSIDQPTDTMLGYIDSTITKMREVDETPEAPTH